MLSKPLQCDDHFFPQFSRTEEHDFFVHGCKLGG
jgi:hypothetical protein